MKKLLSLFSIVLILFSCNNDPCEDQVCINGDCYNGKCECLTGYTGKECTVQNDPKTITIDKITLLEFPSTDQYGNPWDPDSGPDLVFEISCNKTLLFKSEKPLNDVIDGNFCVFEFTSGLPLTDLFAEYHLTFLDKDSDTYYENMVCLPFELYNRYNDFPKTVQFETFGYIYRLDLSYEFQEIF